MVINISLWAIDAIMVRMELAIQESFEVINRIFFQMLRICLGTFRMETMHNAIEL